MKLRTHIVVGAEASIAAYLLLRNSPVTPSNILVMCLLGAFGALENVVLDVAGHRGLRRTRLHSLFAVVLLSALLSLALKELTAVIGLAARLTVIALALFAGAASHLVLDMFTESGVYLLWPLSDKRCRVVGWSYDNPLANALAVSLATLLLLATMYMRLWPWLGL